jgi:hypothetical protein
MHFGAPEVAMFLFIVLLALIVLLGAIAILRFAKRKMAEKAALEAKKLELMNTLLQKFESSKELVEFLKSDEGRQWTERLTVTPMAPSTRAVLLVGVSVLCLWFGLGSLITSFAAFAINSSLPPLLQGGGFPVGALIAQGIMGAILTAAAVWFFWLSNIWRKN